MPKTLANNHDSFIKGFFSSGSSEILGKSRAVLAKDYFGCIFPAELHIQFSYH